MHGNKNCVVSNHLRNYRNFDGIDGEPLDFEWNIFTGFNTLQLNEEVKCLLLRKGETPENFTRRIIFMTMFNDISCGSRDNEKECLSNANLVTSFCKEIWKRTMDIHCPWFREEVVLDQVKTVHKECGTILRKRC